MQTGVAPDDVEPLHVFQRGVDIFLPYRVGRDDHRHGIVRPRSFVLYGAGYAYLMVSEHFAPLRHDARLVFAHDSDVIPAYEVVYSLDEGGFLASGSQVHVAESRRGITQSDVDNIGHGGAGRGHHSSPPAIERELSGGAAEYADGIERPFHAGQGVVPGNKRRMHAQ